jgi:hypothetical protein
MALVIPLENIFVDDESEQDDGLLENSLDLVIRFLHV